MKYCWSSAHGHSNGKDVRNNRWVERGSHFRYGLFVDMMEKEFLGIGGDMDGLIDRVPNLWFHEQQWRDISAPL